MLELKGLQRLHVGPMHVTMYDGTCVAVTGKSGSGKSIFLRMIADLDPHEGEAYLDGQPCSGMPASLWRRQVTYVPAESGWWGDTVKPHFPSDTDFASLLPAVGMPTDAANRLISQLSTGERQRLALLRALRQDTRVLLLDEPTSGLDESTTRQVEALLRDRVDKGMSILWVTHDPEQAQRVATRRMHMNQGKLQEVSG
jgi:ABC-type iron transport system FetAB ATPase subunit